MRRYQTLLLALLLLTPSCVPARQSLLASSAPSFYSRLIAAHDRGEGVRATYPVSPADARQITFTILQAQPAIAITEQPEAGRILATLEDPYPLFSPEPATTSLGVWISPRGESESEVVVLSRARHLLALGRKVVSETEFHEAFAAAVATARTQ